MAISKISWKKISFLGVLIAFLLNACETDVDVYADHKVIPVVYALLDQNAEDGWQWFRISKTFQGKEDPLAAAQTPDSTLFEKVVGKVIEVDNFGNIVNEYPLIDSTMNNKSEGLFSQPQQKVYGFRSNTLDAKNTYRLELLLDDTYEVSATTTLIDGTAGSVFINNTFSPIIAGSFVTGGRVKDNQNFEINPAINTKRGDLTMNFYYIDVYLINGVAVDSPRVLTFPIGGFLVIDPSNPRAAVLNFNPFRFYEVIASRLEDRANVPNLSHRIVNDRFGLGELEFVSSAAGQDLHTYMEVTSPANEGFQARPVYTNIEGGIGIFAARTVFKLDNRTLSRPTREELGNGILTGLTAEKGFCFFEANVNIPCPF